MKRLVIILGLLFLSNSVNAASSFLFASSEESWLGMGREFYGEDDDITYSQQKNFYVHGFSVGDNTPTHTSWRFTFIVRNGLPITTGVHNTLRSLDYLRPEIGMSLDLATAGHGASELIGLVEVHEVMYLDEFLYKFAADILVLENGNENKWNYAEIRMNSDVPHLVPEPTTALLLLLGLSVPLMARRRNK